MVHALNLIGYEVFEKLSGLGEVLANLELKCHCIEVLDNLRPPLVCGREDIVVALNFTDMIFRDVQRMWIPLV